MSPGRGGAMLRNRLLIVFMLGACFLTASAAWADDVGYVNCSSHPEDTQVFGKARKTPDTVASLPCGERFTVLLYRFIFSRIETRDGKVGYVYSNLISVDHSAASVQQVATARVPVVASNVPRTAAARPNPTPATQIQLTTDQLLPPAAPAPAPKPITKVPETTATVAQPNPTPATQPQPTSNQLLTSVAPAPAPEPAAPKPTSPEPILKVPERNASAAVQPNPAASAQPEPAPAQPVAPAIRPADARTSWERPLP